MGGGGESLVQGLWGLINYCCCYCTGVLCLVRLFAGNRGSLVVSMGCGVHFNQTTGGKLWNHIGSF